MYKQIALKPRLSEKAYQQSQLKNTYVFEVPKDANKHSVARAVSAQFDVVVTEVNVANMIGKPKRTVRKNGRATVGRRADSKKAYVTLAEGHSLPFFAAEEAEAVEADKAEKKADKKKEKK